MDDGGNKEGGGERLTAPAAAAAAAAGEEEAGSSGGGGNKGHDIVRFVDDDDDDDDEDDSDDDDDDSDDDDDDDELSDVSSQEGAGNGGAGNGGAEEDDDDADDARYCLLDVYDEDKLPEYACRYCGIHDPACVARCVESSKWFCNSTSGSSSSHMVHHLVRSRCHQVQLHPQSPLGDTLLECYNCASRNVFVLGFVPASGPSSIVVLLCRVCVETVPALKDMDWELSSWHPLIQDRKFLPWLIKEPSPRLLLRGAREITNPMMTSLEDMWKTKDPNATYADLRRKQAAGGGDSDDDEDAPQPTLRLYEDGFHYQNVLAPLVKLEADYDRSTKESLTEESISVRWDKSLSGKPVAAFTFHRISNEQSRIVIGDELRLKLGRGAVFLNGGREWQGVGYVKKIVDGEVELELMSYSNHQIPEQLSDDFVVEYIWKSTSYDRMQNALKTFAIDDTSVTGYIYHKLLGHPVAEQLITQAKIPKEKREFAVPGLPPLNESQRLAVAAVLQRPLSLIQGLVVLFARAQTTSGRCSSCFLSVYPSFFVANVRSPTPFVLSLLPNE